jgi:hypothetical protein
MIYFVTDMTVDALSEFIPQLLASLHMECLIHGNVDEVVRLLGFNGLSKSNFPLPPFSLLILHCSEVQLCNFYTIKIKYIII